MVVPKRKNKDFSQAGNLTLILCKESFWFLLNLEHHFARDGWVKQRSFQEERGKYKMCKSLESMTQEGKETWTICPCTHWGWEINVSTCSSEISDGTLEREEMLRDPKSFSPCFLPLAGAKVWARDRMRADSTVNREFQNELIAFINHSTSLSVSRFYA